MVPPSDDHPQASLSQGIQGQILQLKGNQRLSLSQPSPEPTPLATQVWVFRDRIPGQGSATWPVAEAQVHPQLMEVLDTDDQGRFQIPLEPGEYTIFAQIGPNLYFNLFVFDGCYAPAIVKQGQVVELLIQDTQQAFT
jgi:hypothetical protein